MDEFLESLPPKLNAKVHRDLGALREEAHRLREPQSKCMGGGLFELRSRQGDDIARSFYFFFSGDRIVVTNGLEDAEDASQGARLRACLQGRLGREVWQWMIWTGAIGSTCRTPSTPPSTSGWSRCTTSSARSRWRAPSRTSPSASSQSAAA
ncbi:type II toxin-antitoxin system RelE/ParE family toxin [Gordonibacter pamelaeae]|uniref:type II toxin-antitoxin system RelE/ParE family toxin n=1 Tax=Gordonibacter pamelaeae TaxID=471189 RepID=UPI003C6D487F